MARRNPYYHGPPSDHFDGTRFFNPGPSEDRSFVEVLRWQLGGGRARWPSSIPVSPAVPDDRSETLRVSMVGHATLLVQVAGLNILTDPVWSDRASPFQRAGPKRVTEPGIRFDCLPPVDAILLSHNHYDHLDLSTLERLHAAHTPLIVTPLGNDQIVRARVPNARIETGDWHQRVALGTEVEVAIVPANHWSARRLGDRRMALWSGFYLFHPRGRLYFAGDTGYGGGTLFRNLRAAYGAPDMALLPIGAYEPRWFMAPQHVNPAEAVRIMTDIGARQAIGIHWGTFQLTNEAREAPVEALRAALEEQAIPENLFRAASPGDVFAAQPGTDTLELLPKSP